nr:bifunctional diguanylate cyclase/phosphodiesterase [Nocardioidaceae bacterium]
FVDLDRFKQVNDQFGHHIGDRLLVAVAERLRRVLRAGDTLARLSGDEFVIVCEGLERAELAELVAQRVATALNPVFNVEGNSLHVTASVGLAFSGPGEEIPETLMRDADFAMYQAKQNGGRQHQLIDSAVRLAVNRRGGLAHDLRDALTRGEFQLAYQPIVAADNGELLGVEALLRWHHPDRGWVMPNDFLPVAESTGLICDIGEWVLTRACRDLAHWHELYGSAIPHVSVNVSPYQVMASGFETMVERVLQATGTDPAEIFLEVTESAFLEDGPRALSVLEETKNLGVGLILDDFGTGYSSLNYLRLFPFDVLKIDQVFIGSLDSPSTRTIVAAIIDLAHGLDLPVVAEGVETEQQLAQITDLGTDRAQGFHFCRPLLIEQIDQRLLQPAGAKPIRLPLPRNPTQLQALGDVAS